LSGGKDALIQSGTKTYPASSSARSEKMNAHQAYFTSAEKKNLQDSSNQRSNKNTPSKATPPSSSSKEKLAKTVAVITTTGKK
jgi:hypothetical protein